MVRAALVGLMLASAGLAHAGTIECHGPVVDFPGAPTTCETSEPAARVSWRDVPPKRCSTMEKLANSSNYLCEAREVAANRKAVGDLIAAGNCADALKAALGTGDLQYAAEVRNYCATQPAAAPAANSMADVGHAILRGAAMDSAKAGQCADGAKLAANIQDMALVAKNHRECVEGQASAK